MYFVREAKKRTPLFLTENIKMDRILTNFFYIVFQVLKVIIVKICKKQSLDLLFLVLFISFYISRYNFSQVFRTSFNIIWKIFVTIFFFFNGSLNSHSPHPFNSQNPLSVTKVSLTYRGFSRILCYDDPWRN